MAKTRAQGQRPMAKGKHQRSGQRRNVRRYPPNGIEWGARLWTGDQEPPEMATGATAGTPGYFTPTGSYAPTSIEAMDMVTANPTAAWTTGQYVTINDASDSDVYWNGTQWMYGRVGDVVPFSVVGHTIAQVQDYVNGLGDSSTPENQTEIERLLDEEEANDNRSTLVSWLEAKLV